MRVLYVAADPALRLEQQGGAGTHIRGTIEALRGQGVEVETLVGAAEESVGQRPAPRLRRVPSWVKPVARDARLLLHNRTINDSAATGFDCVYERSAYLVDAGNRLAKIAGVPLALESDGFLVEARRAAYGAGLPRIAERMERRKLRSADRVVVMAEALREPIAERYGVAPEKIVVKGLGVERNLLDRQVEEPPSELVVGFAGTFQPYHGLELLVAAARRLQTDTSFVLVGDGPTFDAVGRAAEGLRVDLPGRLSREETLARLTDCRVLVIPDSAAELYPIKLLEYAALGRPVVAPALPAYREFRRGGRSLLFEFERGSVDGLATAIKRAAAASTDDDRVSQLRELVAAEYSWDAVGRRLAHALEEMCA